MQNDNQPRTYAVTGSTGLVGAAFTKKLIEAGHKIQPLVRTAAKSPEEIFWNPRTGQIESNKLEGIDAVVNLAGENIAAKRWSGEFKREIEFSRVEGTRVLSEALAGLKNPPKVFVNASAIGFYGSRGEDRINESSSAGSGFLAEVAEKWECATQIAADAGIRVVILRIGVVISRNGGALAKMIPPFKLGLGGRVGSGKQWMSWIALSDLVNAILFLLGSESVRGPVNAVSPHPVTNQEFASTLAKALKRPCLFPLPAFAARLIIGEMADETLLSSCKIMPDVLLKNGFNYSLPKIEMAIASELAM